MRARLPASAQPGLTRAGPARLVPLRLADWRFGESQSHLWPSVFRAGPYGLPCCPSSHDPALHTTGQKCEELNPATRYDRRPSIEPNGGGHRSSRWTGAWRKGRSARLLQRQQSGARPRVPDSEANKPRAPDRLRSVRDCHEGCKPGRCTTGRYIQCSTNAPAPADAGPPVAAALYITPVVPLALSGLSR